MTPITDIKERVRQSVKARTEYQISEREGELVPQNQGYPGSKTEETDAIGEAICMASARVGGGACPGIGACDDPHRRPCARPSRYHMSWLR